MIGADVFFIERSKQLAELTVRHTIPASFHFREFVIGGGLMSYVTAAASSAPLPWRGMRAPPVQPVPPPPQSGRRTFATMREIALLSVVALRATSRADRGIGSSSNPLAVSRSRENVRSICTVILG
jgi:hypothetical protein